MGRRRLLQITAAMATAIGARACGDVKPEAGTRPSPTPTEPAPSPSPTRRSGEVSHGPRDRPQVALTFHGQGDPVQADRLLAALEKAGAAGTVLAVGSWLDSSPEVARRILGGGHELGNHTQTHPALTDLAADAVYAEITGCADRLHHLTGSIGAWFRPSQTPTATPLIQAQARRAGYPACLAYDVDSLDYTDPPPAAVTATVLGAVQPGSIVSLHLGHETTIAAMPGILSGLAERGLRAVTASELLR